MNGMRRAARLRIFHGKVEIAGQMGILCGELKRRGYHAAAYNVFHSYLGYEEHLVNTSEEQVAEQYRQLVEEFDLFHFHYASSLLDDYADLPLIQEKGKKMIMHHWGNDVRFHDQARIHNRYVYTGDSPPNEEIDRNLSKITEYVREAIVQDREVAAYVEPYYDKVHIVPIAIDLAKFVPVDEDKLQRSAEEVQSPKNKERLLVLHAPTNPEFKGTKPIEDAVMSLQSKMDFDYRRIEKMNHEEAIQLYREADLIIDQIYCGSYGLLCVEAMALAKPVITYIREDLVGTFPAELPVLNANPGNIEEKLAELLADAVLRKEIGARGRAYVEKYHAKEVVVDQLEEIYRGLMDVEDEASG